ncbi:MAG: DUF6445 family protein [Pyrinomonadaceae bacterium]
MVKRFIQVVDDFYPDPDRIRQSASEMPYSEPETLVGWRTQAYQPRGVRRLIERKFRVGIKYWENDRTAIEICNGVFFSAFSGGRRAETVGVHFDNPPDWVMLLVYLTPGALYDTGTSLWQHRATGLIAKPTRRDAERLGTSVEELRALLARDGKTPRRWIEIDRVGNVYNRAVMFPGGMLHSATKHFGSNRSNGRLYQSFHFPVDMACG